MNNEGFWSPGTTGRIRPRATLAALCLLSLLGSRADALPPYSYELVSPVPVASSGQAGHYWLCSFALNNLGQAAYMWNRRESSTVVWTEVWFFDGTASQLVYSALSSAETRPRCNDLTVSPLSVPSNVGLRDDGLVSFGLTTPDGVVLAYGRPGVGIQGTVRNPFDGGAYSLGPTINTSGRTGFFSASGGTSLRFGTATGSAEGTTSVESLVSLSGRFGATPGFAAAINDKNQTAVIYQDQSLDGEPLMLGFSDPGAAPALQARLLRLGTTLEVYPRPDQPSLNEKGMVAFTTMRNGSNGDPGRVLAIDPVNGSGLITVADTTSGRFASFFGIASLNEFNQVAFLAGLDPAGSGVFLGSVAGTDPIDVLVGSQVVSTPTYSFTYGGGGALAAQSLNDLGQVLFATATGDGSGREVLILATPLATVSLRQSEVAGCKSVTGTVTLPSPAPAGGMVVALEDTLAAATTPSSVTVAAGSTSARFTVRTIPVETRETGVVGATVGGATSSATLAVRPMGLTSVTLTPSSVVGGNPLVGKATLECNAGPGPITVELSSNSGAVASPVAASIVVPQGAKTANFDVTTNPVQARSYATISGTANGITKSTKLTVNVAAAVGPTRLGFGSVPVGTTSGPLEATLTNRGTAPFSVTGISLTGTGASWFAQTSNCPANLAADASCTVSVTFRPQAAVSKSARLSIATSATTTPLSVSLSGTGT